MAGISRERFDAIKARAPQQWPEMDLDTPRGIAEVDRSLREQGKNPTSFGQSLEEAFVTSRPPQSTTRSSSFFGDLAKRTFDTAADVPILGISARQIGQALPQLDRPRGAFFAGAEQAATSGKSPYDPSVLLAEWEGFKRPGEFGGGDILRRQGMGDEPLPGFFGGKLGLSSRDVIGGMADLALDPLNLLGGPAGLKVAGPAIKAFPESTAGKALARTARRFGAEEVGGGTLGGDDLLKSAIQQLRGAITAAKPLQEQNAQLLSEFRKQQLGAFTGAVNPQGGEQGAREAMAALRGAAGRTTFEPLRNALDQPAIDSLHNEVLGSALPGFDKPTAINALGKLLDGQVPVPSELASLEQVFPGLTTTLRKANIGKEAMQSISDDIAPDLLSGGGGRGRRGLRLATGSDIPSGGGAAIPTEGRYRGRANPPSSYNRLSRDITARLVPPEVPPQAPLELIHGTGRASKGAPSFPSAADIPQIITSIPANMQSRRVRQLPASYRRLSDDITAALGSPKPRETFGERIWRLGVEVANVPRQLMLGGELSATGRQGAMLTPSHPIDSLKAARAMFRSVKSDEAWKAVDEVLNADPATSIYRQLGGFWRELDSAVGNREEQFISKLPRRIPGIGRLYAATERAHLTYLNAQAANVFKTFLSHNWDELAPNGVLNREAVRKYARFITVAQGRGDLPAAMQEFAPALNALMLSPRYRISRLQAPLMAIKAVADLAKSAATRQAFDPVSKEIATNLVAYYATGMAALTALAMSDVAEVGLDSNSVDFGKVRIGPVRYDIWAGEQQMARVISQMASGKRTSSAGVESTQKWTEPLINWLRGGLAPVPSLAVDYAAGRDIQGREFNLSKAIAQRVTMIVAQDVAQQIRTESETTDSKLAVLAKGALKAAPAAVGIGVQRYGDEYIPLDKEAKTLGYANFGTAPQSVKNQIEALHPAEVAKISQNKLDAGGSIAAYERAAVDRQQRLAAIKTNTPEQKFAAWDRLHEIELETRAKREALLGEHPAQQIPATDPREQALSAYYDAVVDFPDGSVDWDATDAKRVELAKSWDTEQQAYVDKETGAVDPNLPAPIREMKRLAKDLAGTGFYELRDQAWASLKHPEALKYQNATEYASAIMAQVMSQFGPNVPESTKLKAANTVLAQNELLREYSRQTNRLEGPWIVAHPLLADQAASWGKYRPTADQQKLISYKLAEIRGETPKAGG